MQAVLDILIVKHCEKKTRAPQGLWFKAARMKLFESHPQHTAHPQIHHMAAANTAVPMVLSKVSKQVSSAIMELWPL